ncbi:polyphosphate polymerase domain-containing protein [Pseudarthrobacter raffinosi]|uniref:polyphosphate polymerase domain-containing protein n=1 Tax=Pseudarthrobacter raffinosi TaxID=2953651 RepID=UPI00208FB37A|nr:polyphosphate polymerase domain-containing protein [Pseudarthrobacter sp. MDT3-28]MCO4238038.1 polyphosphate polymerase domain-containing protein [Pseudarthrobacter sp. MDT3-28]
MSAPAGAGVVSSLSGLPAVGLDELNAEAALQTRVDRKYVVPEALAQQLLATFDAEVRVLEMDGSRCFAYDSVYFDTAQLDSYLLAAHGRRRRYKVRTRTYVDSAISFLEVKTEGAREATVKERIPYELTDRARLTAEGLDYVHETLAAAVGGAPAGPLGPVLETRYHRTTLYLPESGSRATIDTNVTWHRPGEQAWVLDGAVILETKSGSAPSPLDRHLWAHGVRPSRISKFATGMAALCPDLPANRWNRTLRRTMTLRPAA